MKVIGIDPAPTKGLDAFDGRDHRVPLDEALAFVGRLSQDDDVLLCWDAPLTGPASAVVGGGAAFGSAFSQRPIEQFFSRNQYGFKVPSGISVLGYSGCPHWAISRSLLGYPRVGPYDAQEDVLPFRLIARDEPPQSGRCVVEVHPALAIWLWCREARGPAAAWKYKGQHGAQVVAEIWEHLTAVAPLRRMFGRAEMVPPASDDQLDARVAFALGRLWLEAPGQVVLLGDASLGTFLVPRVPGLVAAFTGFAHRSRRDLKHGAV